MSAESKFARSIQLKMLPAIEKIAQSNISLSAHIEPGEETGGDFYQFFWGSEDRLYFSVGDVSGGGIPSALFMSVITTLLKTFGKTYILPSEILSALNNHLCDNNPDHLFATLFLGVLNKYTGELDYCNAGHIAPLRVTKNKIEALPLTNGLAIGVEPNFFFQSQSMTLEPNDRLFLYTDGLTKIVSEDVVRGAIMKQDDLLKPLKKQPLADDATFVSIDWKPEQHALSNPLRVHFQNELSEIAKLHSVVELFSETYGIPQKTSFNLNLVLEELLANIISYGYKDHNPHLIYLTLGVESNILTAKIEDDAIAFNPLEAPEADTSQALEERSIGGLGIHFVKALMNELRYERVGDRNILHMQCSFEGGH